MARFRLNFSPTKTAPLRSGRGAALLALARVSPIDDQLSSRFAILHLRPNEAPQSNERHSVAPLG